MFKVYFDGKNKFSKTKIKMKIEIQKCTPFPHYDLETQWWVIMITHAFGGDLQDLMVGWVSGEKPNPEVPLGSY